MNITLKNGPGVPKKAGSTILAPGEPGWSTDLKELFVGTADPQAPHRIAGGSDSFVNVKDFGAKGDGLTDDTAAFRAACGSAIAGSVHKAVYIPTGDYKVGNVITAATIQLTMFGDHRDLSQIHCTPTVTTFDASVDARIAMSAMRVNTTAAATKPFIRTGTGNLTWITMADCTMNTGTVPKGVKMITGPNGSGASGLVICTRSVFTGGVIAMDANVGSVRLFMLNCSVNNTGWDNFARVTLNSCSLSSSTSSTTGGLFTNNLSVALSDCYFITSTSAYAVKGSLSTSVKGCYFATGVPLFVETPAADADIHIEGLHAKVAPAAGYKLVHCPTAPRNLNVNVDMPSTAIDSPTATGKDYRNMSDGIWWNGNKLTP